MAIEWVGAITPSDYTGQVTLRRSLIQWDIFSQNNAQLLVTSFNSPTDPTTPDDTSPSQQLVTTPQLVTGSNVVYDVDAPVIRDMAGW